VSGEEDEAGLSLHCTVSLEPAESAKPRDTVVYTKVVDMTTVVAAEAYGEMPCQGARHGRYFLSPRSLLQGRGCSFLRTTGFKLLP
jgi:hypothetical protein